MARETLAAMMARHGFTLLHTGGGCTAYASHPDDDGRKVMGGGAVLITEIGEPTAPKTFSQPVAVGIYADGDHIEPEQAMLTFPNVRAALRALVLS
jgi:hypothetical protein